MEVKKSRAGRKAVGAEPGAGYMRSREVSIDDETESFLRTAGGGNLSAGVRLAARALREKTDSKPHSPK